MGLCFHLLINKGYPSWNGLFARHWLLFECDYTTHCPDVVIPATIWSDNGTNVVGANNELKQFESLWQNDVFQEKILSKNISSGKSNPAAAPTFRRFLERMVKICKQAMYHVLNGRRLTDELLATILCLTEQLLNSRPSGLTPMILQT